jgi:TonB-linked SusC/RagA family outer membrane protein
VLATAILLAPDVASGQKKTALRDIEIKSGNTISVQELFKLIENESVISFSYHDADLGTSLEAKIDLTRLKNRNALNALLEVSKQEKLKFLRLKNTINVLKDPSLTKPVVVGERITLSGTVNDGDGLPLPGATIILKGTQTGTTTNLDGVFTLNSDAQENTLIVSFLGFETLEIVVFPENPVVNVTLLNAAIQGMDEVVVVGYGQQKRESITGSIAKVDSKAITESKTPNVANALAGRIPGLVVNARSGAPGAENIEILIRGKATTGDTQPLIVIDGVANRGSFDRLNPEDIESISILKDASAAIYGAQAANGVILVTTKRGYQGKPVFSYSNTFAVTQPAIRQQLMNAPQYLTWLDEQNVRNGRPAIYRNVIRDYQNGEENTNIWANTDWWDVGMDTWSPQSQHNLSLTGGNESFTYYASGQMLYQDANFRGNHFGFNQSNVRSNIDVNATSVLKLGLDLAARTENRKGSDFESLIRGIYNMAPFESPYYQNGLLRNTSKGNILPNIDGLNGVNDRTRNVYNTKLSANADFSPWIKGLSLNGFAAIDLVNQTRKDFQKPYDIYFLNGDGVYENLRANTGNIRLFQQADEEVSQTYHLRLNYENTFKNHKVGGFLAYEQNQVRGEYIAASRINLVSENLPYLFTGQEEFQDNDGRGWQSARVNYFGRFNYSYADKYFFESTLRIDGSQNFSPDNRFGSFPGVSAGWRISEEKFWKLDAVDEFKLRASFGKLGNDRVSNFQYLQLYNVGNGGVFGEDPALSVGLSPGRTPNPNITWETAVKSNIGLDVSVRNGLFTFAADAFFEQRSDILARRNASVPLYTGIVLPDENIGKTTNRGFELSATHKYLFQNNFKYFLNAQVTYARNKIVFIDESPFIPAHQRVEGSPIDYLLVYLADGLYQNQDEINNSPHFPDAKPGDVRFVDYNKDGRLTADDRVLLPYGPTPRLVYGFSVGAGWKGLEFSAFFQGQSGAKTIYRPWDINMDSYYFENRWISEEQTPNATSPAAWDMSSSTIQNVSTVWVKDNNFLRIKNVEISYTIPNKIARRFNVSNLRAFVSGNNLGFIYNSVGLFDPESRSDTGWYYPQQRVISGGISAMF